MKNIFLFLFFFLSSVSIAQSDYKIIIQGTPDGSFINPVYSPDGNFIVYTKENYKGLWIYNFQTQTSEKLTDEDAAGFGFNWSSDSKSILARVAKYEDLKRFNAVKIFNVETKSSEQLTDYKTIMPYLPNWIDGDSKIFLPAKDVDATFETGKQKNNSIQNRILAFEKNNKIVVKNFYDNSEKSFEIVKDAQYLNVSLSPNGTKIVFEVLGGNMFVVNSDGTNLIDLGKGNRPRWSHNSQKIIYMVTADNGHEITSSDIYSINSDGSLKTNLTNTKELLEMNPCFSPDGTSIVFDLINDGSIYLMNIE